MKILIIHTTYQYSGGEDTVVYEEMKLLKSYGLSVDLLTFDNQKGSLFKILQLPFNIHSYQKVKTKLQVFKPDVVHIHNLHFGGSPSVIYAIKESNIPFVTTLHNFRLICPSATLFFNGKLFLDSVNKSFPWRAIIKGVYKNSKLLTFWVSTSYYLHKLTRSYNVSNRYIVLSEHAKEIFLKSNLGLSTDQLVVKPNFCYDSFYNKHVQSNYFLYVGRLSEEKGILILLKAFATSGHHIKIAGDGPLKEEVVSYSKRYTNIEFLGKQIKENIFSLMQNCTALVFPSIWFEGMPLTIIEAFSCGTPVIASKLGAMESMITDGYNGLHFKPEDVEDLQDKLNIWLSLKQEDREMYREQARQTYERNYTPSKNAEQLLNIYNSVIEEAKTLALAMVN